MKHAEKLVAAVHEACGSDTSFPLRYKQGGYPQEITIAFSSWPGYDRVTMETESWSVEERISGQTLKDVAKAVAISLAPEESLRILALDGRITMRAYNGGVIITSYVEAVGGQYITKVRVHNDGSTIRAVFWQPSGELGQFLVPDTQHQEDISDSWADPDSD